MEQQEKILKVFNAMMDRLRGQEAAVDFVRQRVKKSGSEVAQMAFQEFENPSGVMKRIGPCLDIIRRNLWPYRALLVEWGRRVGDGSNPVTCSEVRRDMVEVFQSEDLRLKGGMGASLIMDLLTAVPLPNEVIADLFRGCNFLLRLCEGVALIDDWDKNGADVYRLFH